MESVIRLFINKLLTDTVLVGHPVYKNNNDWVFINSKIHGVSHEK